MTLPLPRLRAVVFLHKIKQAVNQGRSSLPFAVTPNDQAAAPKSLTLTASFNFTLFF